MNRLAKLTLKGFKTFSHLEGFEPRALNVLIGANGVGKSNFISFFRLLSWIMASTGNLQRQVSIEGGAHRLLHDGPGKTRSIEACFRFETERGINEYDLELSYAAGDTLIFARERTRFQRQPDTPWVELGAGHRESALIERAEGGDATTKLMRGLLQRCVTYQFHNTSPTSRVRGKWRVSDNRYLKEDGANLAPFLLRLREQEPESYRRIISTLRLIVPVFSDFELEPEDDSILVRWREVGSDMVFDASQASDGTLRTFALVSLLGQPEDAFPNMLILDEPELGLHPYAISILGGLLRRAASHAQVLVATQSVTLVDQLDLEDVIIVEREGRGSVMRRLDPSALEEWLREYTLGELWQKNVIGGRPLR